MNEAGDTPFHLECISGDLEMIKCLDDGKIDSKYDRGQLHFIIHPVITSIPCSCMFYIPLVQRSPNGMSLLVNYYCLIQDTTSPAYLMDLFHHYSGSVWTPLLLII